jgi:hypothetical protein
MTRKAVLKKDLGKLKEGTVLHYASGVFAYKGHTFMPEDVYFDEVHFEVIEISSVKSVHEVRTNPFDIFMTPQLAKIMLD